MDSVHYDDGDCKLQVDPIDLLPDIPTVPWWLEEIEDYLELLHGDYASLREQYGHPQKIPSQNEEPKPHPRQCSKCKTVFHFTKRGGNDPCPFCRNDLHFIVI